jgi:hypothetical protein
VQYEVDWNKGTDNGPDIGKFSKNLPSCMLAAQTGHVVSYMRTHPTVLKKWGRQAITTITLSVRNSREPGSFAPICLKP